MWGKRSLTTVRVEMPSLWAISDFVNHGSNETLAMKAGLVMSMRARPR